MQELGGQWFILSRSSRSSELRKKSDVDSVEELVLPKFLKPKPRASLGAALLDQSLIWLLDSSWLPPLSWPRLATVSGADMCTLDSGSDRDGPQLTSSFRCFCLADLKGPGIILKQNDGEKFEMTGTLLFS